MKRETSVYNLLCNEDQVPVMTDFGTNGDNSSTPVTSCLRVINTLNGARALRFDIGIMCKHCSNGVIFEEEVASIRAFHDEKVLAQLKVEIKSRSLPKFWNELSMARGSRMPPGIGYGGRTRRQVPAKTE